MSTDGDKVAACPNYNESAVTETSTESNCTEHNEETLQKHKKKVSFPEDDGKLVTQYFEPSNPWRNGEWKLFFLHK